MLPVTAPQLQRILRAALLARAAKKPGAFNGSFMVLGDTGIGKTQTVESAFSDVKCPVCGDHQVPVITQHLSQTAPEDLKGLYVYSPAKDSVVLHPNPEFRLGSRCPVCYFMDEFNQCERPIQKASLEFLVKHSVGGIAMPPGSIMVLAGNRVEDGADVEDIVRPARRRISYMEFRFDWEAWKDWAIKAGIHPFVVGFLNAKPSYAYKPDLGSQYGEALPRTWERVSEALFTFDPADQEVIISGTIGDGVASEFMAWVATAGTLMPIVDRVLSGENISAGELSAQFFVNSVLVDRYARRPDIKTAERILQYAVYLADHNPEAAAVMQKDCCRVSSTHRDRMMQAPSWSKSVSRLSAYVV